MSARASIASLALLLVALVVLWISYSMRAGRRGPHDDAYERGRASSAVLKRSVRQFAAWCVQPLVRGLVRAGFTANAVTWWSLGFAVAAAMAIILESALLAGWLYLVSGFLDGLDGSVARARGESTARGAVLDAVVDRYGEGLMLGALIWAAPERWILAAGVAALIGGFTVPYVRARAEAAGLVDGSRGALQRGERVLVVGFALVLSPLGHGIRVAGVVTNGFTWIGIALVALAFLSNATAAYRLARVLSEDNEPGRTQPALESRCRRGRSE